jgi:adenylyl-sulfate kinase
MTSVDSQPAPADQVGTSGLDRSSRWQALGQTGATVWLTGLPAAGKSTIASGVEAQLVLSGRSAYWLDGDRLRARLNRELGFDAASREENVRRTAELALMFADAGNVAVVSLVSPYAAGRERARRAHEAEGVPFFEVWVATPLSECERRDPKGLYARARRGELGGLTGVGDPYEAPASPDLRLSGLEAREDAVAQVIALLDGMP